MPTLKGQQRKHSKKIKPGVRVKSHYSAPWQGIVVFGAASTAGWYDRDGNHVKPVYLTGCGCRHPENFDKPIHYVSANCCLVEVTHNRRGTPMRKSLWKVLHTDWLEVL